MSDVGIVVIGRNEGERLRRCLESVVDREATVVYVDSGSTDGSVALARSLGAEVVELDMGSPYTAARGRNAGLDRLEVVAPGAGFVMFVDGDCELAGGWLDRALGEMEAHPDWAVACGRLRERSPGASIYNRLADLEWDTPIGPAGASGGIAMMRVAALREVGPFDPTLAAGEEPELCDRLRRAGWTIMRIDAEMALHDIGMSRFRQWWRRQFRNGYGAQDVVTRFGGDTIPFGKQTLSAWTWAAGWPVALFAAVALAAALDWPAAGVAGIIAVAGILPLQMARVAFKGVRRGFDLRSALAYGVLTMVGKWAQVAGQVSSLRDHASGRRARLIEYKAAGIEAAPVGR